MLVGPLAFGHVCVDEWFQNLLARTHYRPQRSCGQGYVFTCVCDSVHRGVVCLSACWDTTPPPRRRHPPPKKPPPGRRHPTWKEAPPQNEAPEGGTPQHTVNERPVRILLECILVLTCFWTNANESYGVRWARVCGPND